MKHSKISKKQSEGFTVDSNNLKAMKEQVQKAKHFAGKLADSDIPEHADKASSWAECLRTIETEILEIQNQQAVSVLAESGSLVSASQHFGAFDDE
jgi:hypothetical protein